MPVIYYSYYSPASLSIPQQNAKEHALGRALLLDGLKHIYGISLCWEQLEAALQKGPNGKPCLPGYPMVHFNISHCDGLAVCAFHSRSIGADAELITDFPEVLINKALSEQEKRLLFQKSVSPAGKQEWFFRLWTLKEAYVKKTGTGLDVVLTDFSFSFYGSGEPYRVCCSDPSVSCFQKRPDRSHIISLCYEDTCEEVLFTER